jgi:amino acid transporter
MTTEAPTIDNRPEKLIRAVGLFGLVLFCINAVVGSGVYLLPSESYKFLGPFSLWAPLLFAIPVFILVLNFAEAASHFTKPGGAYQYARTAFGDFIGFETGWMNTIARVTSLASLANGFVLMLRRIVPEAGEPTNRAILIVASLVLSGVIHALGIKFGARTIYFFTWGKTIPLLIFITVALIAFRHNPIPASFDLPGLEVSWSQAILLLLFAYAGFENLGIPAGEYKNPRRDLPFALLLGILAIALIYSLSQLAAMSALPDLSATDTPIADAAAVLMGEFGAMLVTIGGVISILGTNLGTTLEGSRMIYSLTYDRKPYRGIGYIHPRFRTPIVAIVLLVAIAIPVALAGSFAKLAVISAIARLTTYLFTCAAVPKLRKISEGFRAPGGLLVPILGVLIATALFVSVFIDPSRDARELAWKSVVALAVGAILWSISWAASRRDPRPTLESSQ